MAKPNDNNDSSSVIEIRTEEIQDFDAQVKKFKEGKWDEIAFQAFRLKQGVYGQRQPDAQMVRVKAPFGGLSAIQLEALGEVAEKYAPLGKGHVTTRENIQYHHVPIQDTPKLMEILGDAGLSTREACGNTVRNVTGCPLAGVCEKEPFDVTPYAGAYARYFLRHQFTQALPRKIKTAFSGCESDCAITSIHDIGFLPVIKNGEHGFKMVVGGGTSIMPKLAPTLYEFVDLNNYLKITEAVLRIFHRSDELRKNRMKARIKFLIARIGIDEFRKMVEEELQKEWAQKSYDPTSLLFIDDEEADAPEIPNESTQSPNGDASQFERWISTNVQTQKQSEYMVVTAKLPLGDINSKQFFQLADLTRKYSNARCRLSHQQNLVIRWVPTTKLYDLWLELKNIGFAESEAHRITDVVSCPGTDSCKLGITSSMGLGRAVTEKLKEIDSGDALVNKMHVKMSGCPNGCGQHHIADIGMHGAAGRGASGQIPAYEFFVAGSYAPGNPQLGQRLKTKIPAKLVPEMLEKIIDFYKENRNDDEEFGAFVSRVGVSTLEPILQQSSVKEVGELNRETIDTYIDWDKTIIYKLERGEGECAI